jgi:hypothetical protein
VGEELPPEFIVFDIAPFYDAMQQLAFIKVIYEIDNVYPLVTDAHITLKVMLEGVLVEEILLSPSNELQPYGIKGTTDYQPGKEWQQGHYTFRTELYYGDQFCATSVEKDILGNLVGKPAVISWGLLAGLIGSAFFISIVTVVFILFRYRRLNRRLWFHRLGVNERIFNQVTGKK